LQTLAFLQISPGERKHLPGCFSSGFSANEPLAHALPSTRRRRPSWSRGRWGGASRRRRWLPSEADDAHQY
jgi:hypothetical protein